MAKSLIFLADGMADHNLDQLGGKTPLEAASTPAMDSIAANGCCGTFLTLPEGLPTSSDVANMSVLGFYPEKNYPGRGPIEAVSQGVELAPDDVAWRCNLVTISPDGIMEDYSAGHIDNEVSRQLIDDLQQEFGCSALTFINGVSYRNLLVLHGKEFSDKVNYHKPDSSHGSHISDLQWTPADDSHEAAFTVKFLNDLFKRTAEFLAKHPLNKGKSSPASHIWPWSPGHKPALTPFSERYSGKTGAIISAVDVIKGLGKCAEMDVIEVPGATGYIDTNYAGKAEAAIKALQKHDFIYLHVEAIDECSHEGNLELKLKAIEDFDAKIVAPVLAACKDMDINFAVMPDHPVPIELRKHTRTPVPVAIMGPAVGTDEIKTYSENLAPQGTLGFMKGDEIMKLLMGLK
ncbi:MAG: cofactor-independent phosphoglycerate mutase [Lentisphaerae bacterium]|nr:cofactor-independent phosphoglycerate mutase [Lentisphaerota bacterium]MCP4100278.1 cofactor-independent phosphoglycerate mutase [Lentisphaerota bacterium]